MKIELSKEEQEHAKEWREEKIREDKDNKFTKFIQDIDNIEETKLQRLADEKGIKVEAAIAAFTDHLDMAKQFIKIQPVYYDKSKMWWMWGFDGFCWEMVDEVDLLNKIDKSLLMTYNTIHSQTKNNIIEALKRIGRKNYPKEVPRGWVQFKDKIIDINSNNNSTATPEYHITNPIPWEIGGSDETPIMDKIFEEWVGKEFVITLYEIIAYCLLPDYPIHRMFCLNGSGLNGKGKFNELLVKFLGPNNVCSSDLDLLMTSRFELGKLYKKLLCQMGETNFNAMKKTSLLKRLTGGDLVGFEFKNKLPFDAYNYSKLLISTNTLPITYDKTLGFYRRWTIIDFPNQFTEERDILEDIPDIEYNNLAKKCIGILNNLLEKREFSNQGTIEDRRKRFEELSNPMMLFVKTYCIKDHNEFIIFGEFKDRLDSYLLDTGRRVMNAKEIATQLTLDGYERKRTTEKSDEGYAKTVFQIWGLSWKDNSTDRTDSTGSSTHIPYRELSGNISTIGPIEHNSSLLPLEGVRCDLCDGNFPLKNGLCELCR